MEQIGVRDAGEEGHGAADEEDQHGRSEVRLLHDQQGLV